MELRMAEMLTDSVTVPSVRLIELLVSDRSETEGRLQPVQAQEAHFGGSAPMYLACAALGEHRS